MILVSACLAGIPCRYDGKEQENDHVISLVAAGRALPVCPEQLGGLPTPRTPAERVGALVLTRDGQDVTEPYQNGAAIVARMAELTGCTRAILKSRSPACGCGKIYDGTFSGKLIPGDGVLAERLLSMGIEVQTEEDF